LEAIVSTPEELFSPPTVFLGGKIRNEHEEAVEKGGKEGVNPTQCPVDEPEERSEEESAYDNEEKAPCKAKDKGYRNEHPPPAHSKAKKNPNQVVFLLPCPFPRHNEAPVFAEEVKVVPYKFEEEKKGKPEKHAANEGG